jgi:hypothetical protein
MKKLNAGLALLAAFALSGCYHAVIDTGRAPNGTTIERPWAHGFIFGLVPPSVTETAQKCPGGVAKVETKHSFLNSLVGGLTYGIYTPMTVMVSCTGAKADATLPTIEAKPGKGAEAVQQAVDLAKVRDISVYVQF